MKKVEEAVAKFDGILPICAKSFIMQLKDFCNSIQINIMEANILTYLSKMKKYFSQKEICEISGTTASSISRLVDDLEAKGLAKRQAGDSRRENIVSLTDTGQETAKSIDELTKQFYRRFLLLLNGSELDLLIDIFNKIEKELK